MWPLWASIHELMVCTGTSQAGSATVQFELVHVVKKTHDTSEARVLRLGQARTIITKRVRDRFAVDTNGCCIRPDKRGVSRYGCHSRLRAVDLFPIGTLQPAHLRRLRKLLSAGCCCGQARLQSLAGPCPTESSDFSFQGRQPQFECMRGCCGRAVVISHSGEDHHGGADHHSNENDPDQSRGAHRLLRFWVCSFG